MLARDTLDCGQKRINDLLVHMSVRKYIGAKTSRQIRFSAALLELKLRHTCSDGCRRDLCYLVPWTSINCLKLKSVNGRNRILCGIHQAGNLETILRSNKFSINNINRTTENNIVNNCHILSSNRVDFGRHLIYKG